VVHGGVERWLRTVLLRTGCGLARGVRMSTDVESIIRNVVREELERVSEGEERPPTAREVYSVQSVSEAYEVSVPSRKVG
jgi:hypothetical protein